MLETTKAPQVLNRPQQRMVNPFAHPLVRLWFGVGAEEEPLI